ncbi:TonB-dependent receptor [Sphingomonas sp. HITSZ_GF]|uniref:TonB-dependent receptor n=1 Tax=Sphingomonas sp. HITSZ_GF TaxID=3037247 RepID=UPI00240E0373|nr:TonB-dependent receptor [Sphingomonas sp. HITSZ_GF]MDG2534424.1 TonB-dependent receptor [Sphingomonas sp. HITSZ_GF]
MNIVFAGRSGLRATLLAGSMLLAMPAFAQESGDAAAAAAPEENGEIVVTALKRNTTVQDTPLAITAVSGETLANANITDAYSLNKIAPGLIIRESNNGGARITLRNIQSAGEPIVGLYYDEIPLIGPVGVNNDAGGAQPDVRLFDVQRVEVLRGPQGTLYGSASMAGTVRLIFSKPKMDEYEGAVQANLTTTDGGGLGEEVYGMVNAPIANDLLAVRVVGFYRNRDGWIDNSRRGLKNINDSEAYGGRVMVRFTPTDKLTIDGLAAIQRSDGFVNNYLWGNTTTKTQNPNKYDAAYSALHPNGDDMDLFALTASYDLGFASLVGSISHQRRFLYYTSDTSDFFTQQQANASRCAQYIGVTTCNATQLETYRTFALSQTPSAAYSGQTTKADTQELRLSSNGATAFNWTLGFYHSSRDAYVHSDVTLVDPATGLVIFPQTTTPRVANGTVVSPANVIFRRYVDDNLDQTAGYVDLSYDITPKFTVSGGARYYDYSKKVAGQVLVGNLIIGTAAGAATANNSNDHGWVFKGAANYKITRDVMLYAEAAQGFRPGGVNQVIGLPQEFAPYAADSLWNYEFGVKSEWFDRMLTINADVYQIDWTNMQISGQTNAQSTGSTFSVIANAGNARIRGVEVEAAMHPAPGLDLRGSLTFADAVLTTDQTTSFLNASGKKGDKITGVPRWTWQLGAAYTKPVKEGLDGIFRVDASKTGQVWTTFAQTEANEFAYLLPSYVELSARIGVESHDGKWGVYVYGNNLLNEVGLSSKGTGTLFGSGAVRATGLVPRVLGIELRNRF